MPCCHRTRCALHTWIVAVSVALAVVAGATRTAPVHAQESDLQVRLTRIRNDVATTEKALSALKTEFRRLKSEEKLVASEIDRLSFEESALVERGLQVAKERDALESRVRSAEQKVEERQLAIRTRLRSLYMYSYGGARPALVAATRTDELERVAVYAGAVRRDDQRRFGEVRAAVEQLILARQSLDASLEEGQRLQKGVQVKRNELEQQRGKLQGVIRQIQDKQQKAKGSLALLTSEASKLEELLRTMTGGGEVAGVGGGGSVSGDKITSVPATPESSPTAVQSGTPKGDSTSIRRFEEVVHPEGLFGKSVRVAMPVKGDILQRFGKTKLADFSDMIFSKGLEYKTAEGSQVRAVLGGRVAFAGVMPGFDTVVIVDHGSRSYSLYGRLGKSFVKTGDVVGQREPLGVTSTPDERGRNFYFETRKNGAPVDPSSVLARAS